MFETLQTNILALLATTFPDHSQLPFAIEVDRNRQGVEKGFAVLIQDALANEQVVGRTTLDVTIDIKLSDRYAPNRNGDSAQQTVSLQLAQRCLDAFEALATSKLNNSSGVRLVTLRQISEPEFLNDEKTIFRTLTLTANIRV